MSLSLFRMAADNTDPASLSSRLRRRRFECFRALLRVGAQDRILDVGGTAGTWFGSGLEEQVTILNIEHRETVAPFRYVAADACAMDFPDGAFDVVFSNSVIEHVGDATRQRRFASEVQRVAPRHWVQTPWKHFPIEPHLLFPFFQYLPAPAQRAVALHWKYSHFQRNGHDVLRELSRLRLLTRRELTALFPASRVLFERMLGIPKSLVAVRT